MVDGKGGGCLNEQIKDVLTKLYENPDLVGFINHMQSAINGFQIEKFIPRVKTIESAQRTARVKSFKSIEDANDYIGVSFVVRDENQIYDIAQRLKQVYPNSGSIDFLAEENVYSPLCYIKKVPPLSYNIITREKVGTQENVPVEIRICTKEAHLSNQAVHDTVYKNDNLEIPFDEKIKLLCLSQHIVYKLGLLGMRRNLSETQRQKHEDELRLVLDNNKAFLAKHAKAFESVIVEYGMSAYEYEHSEEFAKLPQEQRKARLSSIRKKYAQMYFQNGKANLDFVERANKPIQEMRNIKLASFCEGLEPND